MRKSIITKRSVVFLAIIAMILTLFATPVFAVSPVNLITNGDFEDGNQGFTTDYTYVDTASQSGGLYGLGSLDPEQHYAVGSNPFLYHQYWTSYPAYGGSGNMMIVNATPTNPEKTVWQQTVTLPACEASSPLYAGKNILVGDVLVKTGEEGKVCVKFVLNADAVADGWLITEAHAAVADDASLIPQKNGNPIPGKFPVNVMIDPGVTETGWYCLDRNTGWTGPLAIAAHAVVKRTEQSVTYSETAWGGTNDFSGKNWARYIQSGPCVPTYAFSFQAANSHPDNPAELAIYVDGTLLGTADLAEINPLVGTWKGYQFQFSSSADSAEIKIVDTFTVAQGDDFALDHISLVKLP